MNQHSPGQASPTLRQFKRHLFFTLVVCFLAGNLPAAEEPDRDELRAQAQTVLEKYQEWGLKRVSHRYWLDAEASLEEANQIKIPEKPNASYNSLYLRNGEKFRMNGADNHGRPYCCAFDGKLARFRGLMATYNGNIDYMLQFVGHEPPPELPHFVMCPGVFMSDFRWIFGDELLYSRLADSATENDIRRFEMEDWNGYSCWKLTAIFQDAHGDVIRASIWLSKDHDLMPVKMLSSSIAFGQLTDYFYYEVNEFQRETIGENELWLPKESSGFFRNGNQILRIDSEFTSQSPEDVNGIYSNLPLISKTVAAKRPTTVKPYIPDPVFDEFAATANRFRSLGMESDVKFWGPIILLLMGSAFCISLLLLSRYTKAGNQVQKWVEDNPTWILLIGLVVVGVTYYYTSIPRGWHRYGVSMVLASIVGFALIGVLMLIAGKRVISLKMTFVIAACAAALFAGYNQGFQKLRNRQSMIQDIRASGGHVHLISWEMRSDGVMIPPPLTEFVSDVWTSKVISAAIPAEIFDSSHTRAWNLDETEFLCVSRLDYEPFDVDEEALERVAGARDLWRLDFKRGRIAGEHFNVFETLPALESLGFDCNAQALPSELNDLSQIKELRLTQPIVDRDFIDALAQLPNLESISMTLPEFPGEESVDFQVTNETFPKLRAIEVHNAKLNHHALKTIGVFPADTMLQHCYLAQSGSPKIDLSETKRLIIQSCVFRDKDLALFNEIPNLSEFGMSQTNVTMNGFESFSNRFPKLALQVE